MRARPSLIAAGTIAIALAACGGGDSAPESGTPWTAEEAAAWYADQPWLVGANFVPSTAVNQLEMWQADTFDETTIDRELGFAEAAGLDTIRVFLHDLLWQQDPDGFLDRIDRFLAIADRHHIRTMLVLFDGVWDPAPHLGAQPAPIPFIHNSRWVQSPGAEVLADPARFDDLESYVTGVVGRFADDPRVVIWDIFNEANNTNFAYLADELPIDTKSDAALALMRRAYGWARSQNPIQPITSPVFFGDWSAPSQLSPINDFMLHESDIITFHGYFGPGVMTQTLDDLAQYGRPVVCTEYLARSMSSTFQDILPVLADRRIGAYNWGWVDGKTQTKYPWSSWTDVVPGEPDPWFHDVLHPDGTPYDATEIDLIRSLATTVP